MTLPIWTNHLFIKPHYFQPMENCYIKIQHVYFNNFNALFKTVCHWEIDF